MDKNSVVIPSEMQAMYDSFHFAPAVKDGDRLFCSGVIGIGPDGKLVPYLAKSWEQTPNSITFTLRSDATCADGTITEPGTCEVLRLRGEGDGPRQHERQVNRVDH